MLSSISRLTLRIGLLSVLLSAPVLAQEAPVLNAAESDPNKMGWMVGSPPPEDKIIRVDDPDAYAFPRLRWTVCHFRQLMPTVNVSRGLGDPVPLEEVLDPAIDAITFTPLGGDTTMTWAESLEANYSDGVIVMQDGVVVYKRYSGCLTDLGQHALMSVTKSVTGLLGETLVVEGKLDENAKVSSIIPELAKSGFGDATVRQVLDMTTALDYTEDYNDPNADIWTYSAAGNPLPKPADYKGPRTYFQYLETVKKSGEHGEAFGYRTINSDAMGWIIARVTGKPLNELLSERIWSQMGADQSGYYTVDSIGTPYAGGGLNAGLTDLARIGELMLNDGAINGKQLVPEEVIASIRAGGSKEAFAKADYNLLKGWSYRAMWWITNNAHGAFMARGVHGQSIYVDPEARMVIARFSSHPQATNSANDPTSLPAFEALGNYFAGKGR